MKKTIGLFIIILFFGLAVTGCNSYHRKEMYWPTEGWMEASPESMGMDSEKFADLLEVLESSSVDSVTIIRNGYVVLDAYRFPCQEGQLHDIYSCTKSITSALIGIAIDHDFIKSVEQPLFSFFPDEEIRIDAEQKNDITLYHALTMTTGIDFRDSHVYNSQNLRKLHQTENWSDFIFNLPMKHTPGSFYEYSNITAFLLSAVIHETTGMKTSSFADRYFFSKLGITHYIWKEHMSGINFGNGAMRMNNRDMAKIGYLFLENGRWDGEQIIPKQWIDESTSAYMHQVKDGFDYGYQWWIEPENLFFAQGKGGQFIIIDRENNLVVVFTSSFPDRYGLTPMEYFSTFIIPSIISDKKIPENPDSLGRVQDLAVDLAQPDYDEDNIVQIPAWLERYDSKEIEYNDKIFQTRKIMFEVSRDTNELFVNSFNESGMPVRLRAGLAGDYALTNIRTDMHCASKAAFTDDTIVWDEAIPELAWSARYIYRFSDKSVRISVTDLNGNIFSTEGIVSE